MTTTKQDVRFTAMNIVNQLGDLWSPHIPVAVRQSTNDEADQFVQDMLKHMRADILREVAAEWDAEYESLTAEHGAYGETKLRAAYRLGSVLLNKQADA